MWAYQSHVLDMHQSGLCLKSRTAQTSHIGDATWVHFASQSKGVSFDKNFYFLLNHITLSNIIPFMLKWKINLQSVPTPWIRSNPKSNISPTPYKYKEIYNPLPFSSSKIDLHCKPQIPPNPFSHTNTRPNSKINPNQNKTQNKQPRSNQICCLWLCLDKPTTIVTTKPDCYSPSQIYCICLQY